MPKELITEPASTFEMGGHPPDLAGVRAHYTIRRKPGVPTAGMTYHGLHVSAEAAEVTRQAKIIKPWSGTKDVDGRWIGITEDKAAQMTQEWLDSTEVVELAENEKCRPHGESDKIHGQTDGVTHP